MNDRTGFARVAGVSRMTAALGFVAASLARAGTPSTAPAAAPSAPSSAAAASLVVNKPIARPPSRSRDVVAVGRGDRVTPAWYQSAPVALGFVLVAIAGCAIVARRFVPPGAAAGSPGALEVVARVHLTSKQSICLIRAGRRLVMVGVTPDHVEHLTDIDDPDATAGILAAAETRKPHSSTAAFHRLVDHQTAAFDDHDEEDDPSTPDAGDHDYGKTRGQLHGLLTKVRAYTKTRRAG